MASQSHDVSNPSILITTYNSEGKSVFTEEAGPEKPKFKSINLSPSLFADLHVSPSIPVNFEPKAENNDLKATTELIANNDSITSCPPAGVNFRSTVLQPGTVTPLHRTLTLDYGIVVAGEVELVLDSGEKRTMRQGDTFVQRATMHQWRVVSENEPVRMVFVILPIEPLEVNGQAIKEEWQIPGQGRKE